MPVPFPYPAEVEAAMKFLYRSLRENDRRRYAAVEATRLGHGGLEYLAALLGCDPKSIRHGQRDMNELGRRQPQGGKEQKLTRCGGNEVVTANDAGDTVVGVIDDDGELIGGCAVRFPGDEVPPDLFPAERDCAAKAVVERRDVADPKSPGERAAGECGSIGNRTTGTGAGVNRLGALGMRRARGLLNVGPRARARIDEFLRLEFLECGGVKRNALRLHDRTVVPIETEPTQVVDQLRRGAGFDARRIDILDAKHNPCTALSGHEPGDQIGASVAQMLSAGRRGREPRDERSIG